MTARRLAVLALVLAVCGCHTGSTAAPATSSTVAAGQFQNPVYAKNFPDPGVLRTAEGYLAFGTNGPDGNVPTLSSPDLVHWTAGPDALPTLGSWATQGNTWAPEVIKVNSGYVLFYVARATTRGVQCIGRATATTPQGPYTDSAANPLVCQASSGGSIDPDPFRDASGKLWLYWKNDGNCCGKPVHLWAQALSADALALTGKPVSLMTNTRSWQGALVEAPEMVLHAGHYVLFYSANDYASDKYAIGFATCTAPAGPCTDESRQPLVRSKGDAAGPGHCFVVSAPDGSTWMLYHAWPADSIGADLPGRLLWLDPIQWTANLPKFDGPDAEPQKAPPTS